MAELIGITTVPRNFKKRLLVFDRIVFAGATEFQRVLERNGDPEGGGADVNWLVQRGLVIIPDDDDLSSSPFPPTEPVLSAPGAVSPSFRGGTPAFRAGSLPRPKGIPLGPRISRLGDVEPVSHPVARARAQRIDKSPRSPQVARGREAADAQIAWATRKDQEARDWAVRLRNAGHQNTVPIMLGWSETMTGESRAEVIEVVLANLPVPDDSHALPDVLAFREEARSQGLIQGLRVWINDMASGKLTGFEVSDKLEDLVSRYERTLAVEKMQRDTGVVETLVTTTAEVAESLVKFNWSTAAKRLFEVRRKQIDLMKAEMTLPGREVAYLVKAREQFGS